MFIMQRLVNKSEEFGKSTGDDNRIEKDEIIVVRNRKQDRINGDRISRAYETGLL